MAERQGVCRVSDKSEFKRIRYGETRLSRSDFACEKGKHSRNRKEVYRYKQALKFFKKIAKTVEIKNQIWYNNVDLKTISLIFFSILLTEEKDA